MQAGRGRTSGMPDPERPILEPVRLVHDPERQRLDTEVLLHRRNEISHGKLTELASCLGVERDRVESLLEDAGLVDGI
jgi:hypothetical protein